MKTYDKYKPSGVEWIGEIPDHWEAKKVKHLINNSKYYQIGDGDHGSIKPEMYLDEGIPYIRVQNLTWSGHFDFDGMVYISKETHLLNKKSHLFPNDILIAKTGATVGKLALIPYNIKEANTTSSVGKVTIDLDKYNPRYVLFSFISAPFQRQIWVKASQKSAQPGFNIEDLVDFIIVTPKLKEQTAIANYLDAKTAEIDQTIVDKEELIKLYEEEKKALINEAVTKGLNPNVNLKPSGIDWLGDIPAHWEVKKLKHVAKICNGRDYKEIQVIEGGYPVYGTGGIFNRCSEYLYNKPSVLLGRKGTVDRPIFVNEAFWTSDTIYYTEIKDNVIPLFFYFLCLQIKFDLYIYGSAVPSMTKEYYDHIYFTLPPLQEQTKIVEYIEIESNLINEKIHTTQQEIALLKEYRQALIFEAVTGKICVL